VALALLNSDEFVSGVNIEILHSDGKTDPCTNTSKSDALTIGSRQVMFSAFDCALTAIIVHESYCVHVSFSV
jgi:hypothetical protein